MNHTDPKTSELVDRLAYVAAACYDSTQLRERIAGEVFPVVDQMHDAIQALTVENERLRSLTPNSGEPVAWMEWDMEIDEGDPDSITPGQAKPDLCADGWDWKPLFTHPTPSTKPDLSRLDPFVAGLGKAILAELKEDMAAPSDKPADGWMVSAIQEARK
jgi:hypothetical protein